MKLFNFITVTSVSITKCLHYHFSIISLSLCRSAPHTWKDFPPHPPPKGHSPYAVWSVDTLVSSMTHGPSRDQLCLDFSGTSSSTPSSRTRSAPVSSVPPPPKVPYTSAAAHTLYFAHCASRETCGANSVCLSLHTNLTKALRIHILSCIKVSLIIVAKLVQSITH